jgi:hypothetical protein
MPTGTAHSRDASVGVTAGGTVVSAREKVPSPVQRSIPTNTRAPMPEARRPGRATRLSVAPAMPAASMMRKAPRRGEPSNVLTAAKLPADAMTVTAIGGASFFARRTVRAANPPPIAMSGPSGPSTAPRLSVASAASTMPGRSRIAAGPDPAVKPRAGECPAVPGRWRMVRDTSSPLSISQGTGHQAGVPPSKRSDGRSPKRYRWSAPVSARKP